MKILLTIFLLILAFQFSFGQELKEGEYWDSRHQGKTWVGEYNNFTKEDVIKGNKILSLIKHSSPKDEWEGSYSSNHDGLGEELLFWNLENGFVKYYFYHSLKNLSFGSAKNNEDSIVLTYEKLPRPSKNKSLFSSTLVKVKFNNKHYLITESNLKSFLEDIAGVFPRNASPYYYSLWIKMDDFEKEASGEPQIPAKYKYLLRSPIETKIIKVGKRNIHQEKLEDGTVTNEEIYYFVTLSDGKNKRIKVGMEFFVEDLGEWVEIIKVTQNSSIGKIKRSYYDKIEECWDDRGGSGTPFPCKNFKNKMTAKTKRGEYFF